MRRSDACAKTISRRFIVHSSNGNSEETKKFSMASAFLATSRVINKTHMLTDTFAIEKSLTDGRWNKRTILKVFNTSSVGNVGA